MAGMNPAMNGTMNGMNGTWVAIAPGGMNGMGRMGGMNGMGGMGGGMGGMFPGGMNGMNANSQIPLPPSPWHDKVS